jgi:iron(III) transport system permease protein
VASAVALPILVVLASVAADSDGVWSHLAATVLPSYVRNTVLLALGVGVGTAILGVGSAWLVTMCRFPGQRVLWWALLLPLAIPAYLDAYAYSDLLQFSGPVQGWLRDTFGWTRADYWFPQVRSLGGAIAILSLALYPYVYLASRTAFLEQSGCPWPVLRSWRGWRSP